MIYLCKTYVLDISWKDFSKAIINSLYGAINVVMSQTRFGRFFVTPDFCKPVTI